MKYMNRNTFTKKAGLLLLVGLILLITLPVSAGDCQEPEGIHRVELSFSNAWLIEGEKDGRPVLMVVDTGIVGNHLKIMAAILRLGYRLSDLELIYTTHAHIDHYGGAEKLSRRTGAKIVVHAADAEYMRWGLSPVGDVGATPRDGFVDSFISLLASTPLRPTPPDIIVEDGDSLDEYGFIADVIHLPGHTNGSSGLLLYRDNKVMAFSGDLIDNGSGVPEVQRSFAQDWDPIPLSVDKLKAYQPDILFPGHGECFTGAELQGL